LRFAALFLALAVMGGAGVWGLVRLQHRLDEAHADHEQLRTVYEVGNAAQIARLLAMHGVDAPVIEAQLNRAVTAAKPLQSSGSIIEPAARDMAAHLQQAVQWNSAATPTLAVAHLNDALSDVATVASQLSNRIVDNRQATSRQLTQT